jgi:hypothetical protein
VSSNLPPGVTENQIPGNRPEDVWMEKVTEGIAFPDGLFGLPPEFVSTTVSMFLERLDEAVGIAYDAGRMEKSAELAMNDDALGSRRAEGSEQDG